MPASDYDDEGPNITKILLQSIKKSGSTEEEILDTYDRKCQRLKVIPLYGQCKVALGNLVREKKVYIKTGEDGVQRAYRR